MAYSFIKEQDEHSRLINEKANLLLERLQQVNVQASALDDFGKLYFSSHHTGKRLYFSIESSAAIIYHSLKKTGRPVNEVNFTDYSAGLGTLFLLAGMVGFKAVYFNDLFPVWEKNAKVLCDELSISITGYIMGDVDELVRYGKQNNIAFDIVASRNVIEHIYDLDAFYRKLKASGLTKMFYSTTTANYHNPAMLLKHRLYHRKVEKEQYRQQRAEKISKSWPDINKTDLDKLVSITRGRAFADFDEAVNAYRKGHLVQPVPHLESNTCDCNNGVWAEHIIRRSLYADILDKAGFTMEYTPGFWDTHYPFTPLNWLTAILNGCIKLMGKKGYIIAPFVNVIATTK